jgi:hypothetical protein
VPGRRPKPQPDPPHPVRRRRARRRHLPPHIRRADRRRNGVQVGLQRLAACLLFGLKSSSWSRLDHGSPATAASSSVDRPSPRARPRSSPTAGRWCGRRRRQPAWRGRRAPRTALAAMRAFECRSVACLLRTICERAVRARAEDRNYGRTRAQAGARVGRLLLVRSGRSSSAHDVLVPGPKAQARDGTRHERSVPMHCKGESCGPLGRARGAP